MFFNDKIEGGGEETPGTLIKRERRGCTTYRTFAVVAVVVVVVLIRQYLSKKETATSKWSFKVAGKGVVQNRPFSLKL